MTCNSASQNKIPQLKERKRYEARREKERRKATMLTERKGRKGK